MDDRLRENQRSWDERTRIHVRDETGFYSVDAFRRGEDVLGPVETAEIGDVAGLDLLHLQCHFGLDTLTLARRGARVTGLDFSSAAIAAARTLATECGIDARFVEGNLYDAPALIDATFDMVYATWGTICWLPDIVGWAQVVGHFLKPGGRFYFADAHPLAEILEQDGEALVVRYPWRTPRDEPMIFVEEFTYTGDATPMANRRNNYWNHPMSALLSGLIDAGLTVEMIHEHSKLPWQLFPMMVETEDGLYELPDGVPQIPLAFSLAAVKG